MTVPCITVSTSSLSPASTPAMASTNQLAQLSRNASVISTSSSSSASSLVNTPPSRPRPLRQFSYQPPSRPRSPTEQPSRTRSPSRPPVSPSTPRGARAPPPVWVPRELGREDSDSDSELPELAPTSRRGSDARRAHSRKGSVSTVRRTDDMPSRSQSRTGSVSEFAPPSPKVATGMLAGSPKLGQRALSGKRSRVPSTASSAAALAGQLEATLSSNLNPNSRTTAPSPTPPVQTRKRRTQSTSTTANARSRSASAAPRQRMPVTAADFEFGPELGSGSYSTVVKGWLKNTGANGHGETKVYAVKVSDKQYLINKGKVKYANVEKTALAALGAGNQHRGHPGIVKLHWTFHDPSSLYFVLDLVPNGELLDRIKKLGSFTTEGAQYYTAQIVDAVAWMHTIGVVHRDLKPENILLDEAYRIRITDFGSARVEDGAGPGSTQNSGEPVLDQRASSFVGTAEYVSPELLMHNVTSRCSDVWAIGCILFQMLAGRPPFKGGSEYLTLEQVKRLEYTVPEKFDPVAEELVKSILVLEPGARPTMAAIKSHAFLADTVWDELWTRDAPPIESGPVKGPPPPESPMEFDSDSDDAGEMWDRMADGPEQDVNGYLAKAGYFGAAPPKQADDEATPRADYGFQSYRFGEVSSVPIPVTDSEPPSSGTTRPDSRGASESPSRSVAPDMNGRGSVSNSPVLAPTGPHARSSIPPSLPPILSPSLLNADNEIAVEDDDMVPELQPAEQRMRTDPLRASHSSTISGAGTTSSSEGSPLGSAAGTARTGSGERMPIAGGDVEGLRIALAVMGLGGDQERLSSALAPGEKPVFMSSILSRPRHRLTAVMPSKRRILVLTDTPRLLCVKEERDRVVVKSALSFTESGTSPKAHSRGRSIARWKQASEDSTVEPVVETVQSVETKGEKSFVVQTLSKAYTYVAENAEEAGRWVQQIKAVQQIRRKSAQA